MNLRLSEMNQEVYEKINKIQPGDKVRILQKKSTFGKGSDTWSSKIYDVGSIVGNHFEIEGINRPVYYHEIQVIPNQTSVGNERNNKFKEYY